jgi:ElaB/YqjD/DUF883 family membrane-anchored ribosome-binding protein
LTGRPKVSFTPALLPPGGTMNTVQNATHEDFQSKKAALVSDLKRVVVDAEELLHEVTSSTAEEFAAARAKMEANLAHAVSRLDEARIAAGQRAMSAADATRECVRDNPWQALGIAAAAGLIAGCLIARR